MVLKFQSSVKDNSGMYNKSIPVAWKIRIVKLGKYVNSLTESDGKREVVP